MGGPSLERLRDEEYFQERYLKIQGLHTNLQ
jgi:hypothetical protein